MNDAVETVLKVKKEHPEARGKEFQKLVGKEYSEVRVKKLIELGWSFEDISKETGLSESVVQKIAEKV